MITASQAELTLRLIRELVRGAWALRKTKDFTPAIAGSTYILLDNAIQLLDAYLTQEPQNRQVRNARNILLFLTQSPSATCLLTDRKTQLLLRWPTQEDSRVVYPITLDESTESIDLTRRWNRINNANSEAVEFPKEVSDERA